MVRALATIKGYYDYGLFQAVQIAAIMALRNGDEFNSKCRHLSGAPATCWSTARTHRLGSRKRPKATMFVWAQYPKEWRDRIGSIDFSMKLLEEAEVAVSPGRGFGEPGKGFYGLRWLKMSIASVRPFARWRCLRGEDSGIG